jgi:hypothetical protein
VTEKEPQEDEQVQMRHVASGTCFCFPPCYQDEEGRYGKGVPSQFAVISVRFKAFDVRNFDQRYRTVGHMTVGRIFLRRPFARFRDRNK